ncbi:MAG: cation-translocating P-type ATPase, partial [Balneolaceae bacterium]|nr:cation-translocating P-type ATPase [Balneolaceae bacterium]
DIRRQQEETEWAGRLVMGGIFSLFGLVFYILFLYPLYLGGEGLVALTGMESSFIIANIWVMTTFVLCYTGWPILRGAWVSLTVMKPNMDLLVSLAALSAYCYSVVAFMMGMTEVYFDVTVAIVMVVSLGNFYEHRIRSRKSGLMAQLTGEQIREARLMQEGSAVTVPLEQLKPGDRVLVKAGERVPIDGTIVDGEATVNEALITGESLPVRRKKGDSVIGGTLVTDNALIVETGPDAESTLNHLVRLMWNIQSSSPGIQRLADRLAAWFVPVVLLLAAGTLAYLLINGHPFNSSMLAGLSVLIVSCPCALGLATPMAVASGVREALENRIVIKDVSVLERGADIDIVALDKTGTLTTGSMQLLDRGEDEQALALAAAVERFAAHPAARAIAESVETNGYSVTEFDSFSTGVRALVDGKQVYAGEPDWVVSEGLKVSDQQQGKIDRCRRKARIPVAVGWDGEVRSILEVGDRLRPESKKALRELAKERKVVLITGDSEAAAEQVREELGLKQVFANVRPEAKSEIIRNLRKSGSVAMIGDGSNDAPALAEADIGIAFGPTALAADSADIVILDDRLERIFSAFSAADRTRIRIRQNLGWAFLYNVVAIPLAVAGMINPLFAALAMAGSSILVVINSSRSMKLERQPD